jgi:hypothetical protein
LKIERNPRHRKTCNGDFVLVAQRTNGFDILNLFADLEIKKRLKEYFSC